jgi:hypothetical protein
MSKNYSAIIDLINTVAGKNTYPLELGWGEVSDINAFSDNKHKTLLWMMSLIEDDEFINTLRLSKNYLIELFFYQEDNLDSSDAGRREIMCDCDDIATKFELDLANTIYNMADNVKRDIEISKFHKVSVFKKGTWIYTGIDMTFNLTVPDDFDYCP